MEIITTILKNILFSAGGYLIVALTLVLVDGKSKKDSLENNNLEFKELNLDYNDLPEAKSYMTRDQRDLNYRYYPSQSNKVLILLHGSGWHSRYFLPLANSISKKNFAHVYTPDLRGHGTDPDTRGDIEYIDQLEDDIHDLIQQIKKLHKDSRIIIGGHSSGGGLALRFAGSIYGREADAYLFLSPYLKYNSPTMIKNSGGWTSVHMPRIIGLSMLNNIGIRLFNKLNVIDFNMPIEYRDGSETLSYSYRLNTGYAPRNYTKDLLRIDQKLLVVVGSADEAFKAEEFLPEISKYKPDVKVSIIESVSHMGIVVGEEVIPVIRKWLSDIE